MVHTTLLVYKMREDAILHDKVRLLVESRKQTENSIRMGYINTVMCINSDSEELKEEKRDYDKYISEVSNISDVEKQGYFFRCNRS